MASLSEQRATCPWKSSGRGCTGMLRWVSSIRRVDHSTHTSGALPRARNSSAFVVSLALQVLHLDDASWHGMLTILILSYFALHHLVLLIISHASYIFEGLWSHRIKFYNSSNERAIKMFNSSNEKMPLGGRKRRCLSVSSWQAPYGSVLWRARVCTVCQTDFPFRALVSSFVKWGW